MLKTTRAIANVSRLNRIRDTEVWSPVYMRPGQSQIGTNIEICIMFTWDQNEIIPGPFRSGHNSFYMKPGRDIYMKPGRKLLRPVWSHPTCWPNRLCSDWDEIYLSKVYTHPALISSRSERSRFGLEGGMTSDLSEQFSSRSHVNIYYRNYYDRNEIAPVWLRPGLM